MRLLPVALVATFLAAAPVRAEPPKPAEPPKTFDVKAVDAYLAAVAKEKGYPGLSVAVVRDGKLVLAKGYGKRSLEENLPVEADTPFWIGSVTKQFACACVLLLAEDGKLSAHDKVAKYFPSLTRAQDISLYDLMAHTSGYPDYYPLDFVDRRMAKSVPVDQAIAEYAGGKLDFEPGHRWSYSNTGYLILGRVVEKVSGEAFGKFLERRILKPLGMEHSAFEPDPHAPGLARGYTTFALGPWEPAVPEAGGWLYTAGGLTATASDLARWDLALVEGKVLKPESFKLMTTPRKLAGGKTRGYGCGLAVSERDGETILAHGGAVSGFLTSNTMVPRTRSAVVVMTNGENLDPGSVGRTLLTLLLKDRETAETPEVPKIAGPSPKEAALDFLHQMQGGKVDRAKLGQEFSIHLSDERLREAAPRLKALGEPEKVEVEGTAERGGMEVAQIRMTFKNGVLKGALYRSPDGKIQQLLFRKG